MAALGSGGLAGRRHGTRGENQPHRRRINVMEFVRCAYVFVMI